MYDTSRRYLSITKAHYQDHKLPNTANETIKSSYHTNHIIFSFSTAPSLGRSTPSTNPLDMKLPISLVLK
jgi:hypothetical protein